MLAASDVGYPFVQAKYQGGSLKPTMIVLHSMEAPEGPNTAENVARYFQTISHPASAHFCVDENSVVQCVPENVVAYHAPPANGWAIGIEQAGYTAQTHDQWLSGGSHAMFLNTVNLAADLCRRHGIPPVFRTAADLVAGHRDGITTHVEVSHAFGQSTHTDPGPGYPIGEFIWLLAATLNGGAAPAPLPPTPAPVPAPPAPIPTDLQNTLRTLAVAVFATKLECAKRPLRQGDGHMNGKANFVKVVQLKLAPFGVAADGEFGPTTDKWVRWFQAVSGEVVDGQVGAATIGAMYP